MNRQSSNSLKFVIFKGGGLDEIEELHIKKDEVFVGRADPETPDDAPSIDLVPDFRVSRKHARLYRSEQKWMIEDCCSTHGTTVDGQQIKDCGAIEISPGSKVVTS